MCLLLENLDSIHTTTLGYDRIKKNLNLKDVNPVEYCKKIIKNENSKIKKIGKNYYIEYNHEGLCVNASSYTIITAYKL